MWILIMHHLNHAHEQRAKKNYSINEAQFKKKNKKNRMLQTNAADLESFILDF